MSQDMFFKQPEVNNLNILRAEHLYIHLETSEVILLGYPLRLSALEFKILKAITYAYPSALTIETLCKDIDISRDSLAVHICSINKKAAQISERRLILFSNGYCLNEYM